MGGKLLMMHGAKALGLVVFGLGLLVGCKGAVDRAQSGSLESQKAAQTLPAVQTAMRNLSVPPGFEAHSDAKQSGQLLYRHVSGGRAFARPNMREFLFSLRGYFDGPITVMAATSDAQDTVVHAMFSSTLSGKPVEGVAAVVVGPDGSSTSLVYDSPGGLRESYSRLSGYFANLLASRSRSAQNPSVLEAAPHAGNAYAQVNLAWDQELGSAATPSQEAILAKCQKNGVACRGVSVEELTPGT